MSVSIARKIAGTGISYSQNTITVGDGGDYLTIAAALAYIATQPTMVQVSTTAVINCTKFSHWCPRVSGLFNDAAPGDFLYLTNDDPNDVITAFNVQYDWHYYRILSAIDNSTETVPGLLLEHCIVGNTQNGVTAAIYRPTKFKILLLDETCTTTGATMPDGYDISITGFGRDTVVTGTGIAMPIYGHTEFANFRFNQALTKFDSRTYNGTTLIAAGFSAVSCYDLWMEGENSTFLADSDFQSIRINRVDMTGFKGHRVYCFLQADYIRVENVTYNAVSTMELIEVIGHKYRCNSSWKKIAKNCHFRREVNTGATGPGAGYRPNIVFDVMPPVAAGIPKYKMDWLDCTIEDDNTVMQLALQPLIGFKNHNNTNSPTQIRFIDSRIINNNSNTYDVGLEDGGGYTADSSLTVEFINTKGVDGRQVTENFVAGTAIIKYKHPDSYRSLPFAAFLVPDATLGDSIIFDALTANVSLLDITSSQKGMTRRIHFTQDATGGRTITWLGGAYKIHTNPVGAANQKAIFELYYDGAHWVQMNATAWI